MTPSLAPLEPGLYFRMQSDWGSAFSNQEVNYVIAAQNTRASGDMRDLQIHSALPANLEVLSASASYGVDPNLKSVDVALAGNDITLKLDVLRPGEQVFIAIKTKVKDGVAVGTQIISQAELTFTGISMPAHSNTVTVLIVGAAPTQLGVAQAQTQAATTAPTTTIAATETPTAPAPTATIAVTATTAPAGAAPPSTTPLPETSSGVPILGFALLGMTLMLRTVRVHRAQSRI